MPTVSIPEFIERWSKSGGAERANYALFLSELCDLLEVPRPEPTQQEDDDNAYVFERRVKFINPDALESYGRLNFAHLFSMHTAWGGQVYRHSINRDRSVLCLNHSTYHVRDRERQLEIRAC